MRCSSFCLRVYKRQETTGPDALNNGGDCDADADADADDNDRRCGVNAETGDDDIDDGNL